MADLQIAPDEIIGVDGGSIDNTVRIFTTFGIRVLKAQRSSRAIQMNMGAKEAKSDILVFLHADTLVSKDLVPLVVKHLADPEVCLGGFISVMKGNRKRKIISVLNYFKTYFLPLFFNPKRLFFNGFRILFGDQVMFCRKKDFDHIGRFDESYPILEDAELCIRMNKLGRIVQFPEKVYSSDRRVANQSALRAILIYFIIAIAWTLRIPVEKLEKLYRNIR